MKTIVTLSALAGVAFLSACAGKPVDPVVHEYMAENMLDSCVIIRTRGHAFDSKRKPIGSVSVSGVEYGANGWIKASVSSGGVGGTMYYNKAREDFYCSTSGFSNNGHKFVPLDPQPDSFATFLKQRKN